MGMGSAFIDNLSSEDLLRMKYERVRTELDALKKEKVTVKSVLNHIREDIEFGYDAEMILNKIQNGNYDE